MAGNPGYVGVDEIMDAFDAFSCGKGGYSLWYSDRDKAMDWNDADFEQGRDLLEQTLRAFERAGNSRMLYLKFYPEIVKGIINKKTDFTTCLHIQAVKGDSSAINGFAVPGMHPAMIAAFDNMGKIPAMISGIEQRLVELETNGATIDEPELSATDKFLGMISGLLENPQVQERILGFVMNKFSPTGNSITAPVHHVINGTTDSIPVQPGEINMQMVNDALQRLAVHCNVDTDLMLMAKMAEDNPGMFKFLLESLRKGV